MLKSVEVRGYRGLKHLTVDNLGRVNLIVGKNDSGKTSLLEALAIGCEPERAALTAQLTQGRRSLDANASEFDNYWRYLFNDEANPTFNIEGTSSSGHYSVSFEKSAQGPIEAPNGANVIPSWAIDVSTSIQDVKSRRQIYGYNNQVVFPLLSTASHAVWTALPATEEDVVRFSSLIEHGHDREFIELLRNIEPELQDLKILVRSGERGSINVRTTSESKFLPLVLMGTGFQHCFDIAIAIAASESMYAFIDEVDNGLHHSLLAPVWHWIATASKRLETQVSLTTHSEECVWAAARAFQELGDDGLRVIRIDRGKDGSRAVVYDTELLATAVQKEIEVRG